MSEGWRGGSKPWGKRGRIYDQLKIPESISTADLILLSEPRQVSTQIGQSFSINVGLLDQTNCFRVIYNRDDKSKKEVEADAGEIYGIWLAKTLVQALVNLYPDEDDTLTGKVVRVGRQRVTGGRFGTYLGYTAEEIEDYNSTLADTLVEKLEVDRAEAEAEADIDEATAGNEDLEISYQLLETSLSALGSMSFAQIDNFLKTRRDSGLMRTELSAEEAANFCVAKNPDKFKIVSDGDTKSLVQK